MKAIWVTSFFVASVVLSHLARLWLNTRQARHVALNRHAVPAGFASQVDLASHQRAADYTLDKLRFATVSASVEIAVLMGWTLLGGLHALQNLIQHWWPMPEGAGTAQVVRQGLLLLGGFGLISALIDLPFAAWRTLGIEQRHGFNRMTASAWLSDQLKQAVVGLVIATPLSALVLWLMQAASTWWWAWAWASWVAFSLLLMVIYPIFIAPLFNTFTPLQDTDLVQRVQSLMQRCGFSARGFFVMDGSKRSAHANAYFTGLGMAKRVVFFDTLLQRLSPAEVEAVLAHELGHFRHRHVLKRMLMMFGLSLLGFAALGWLTQQPAFYLGLGAGFDPLQAHDALALLLMLLALPSALFFVSPVLAGLSRRDEYEADAYACQQASAQDLSMALIKLYQDNSSTLTPDPIYVRFHYSHPPAIQRLAAMRAGANAASDGDPPLALAP